MQFQQLGRIILWLLQQLDLADAHILQGVNGLARLFNGLANRVGNELLNNSLQIAAAHLGSHNLKHALADVADLGRLGVAGLGDLLGAALGKGDAEETQQVAIRSLDVNVSLNQGLPFLDHGAQLVRSEGHAVEVGQAGLALDLINTQAELAEGLVLRLVVQVTQAHLQDATTESIVGNLETGGAVDQGLANVAVVEHDGGLEVVPVLAGERINNLFLQTLLSLAQALVLANNLQDGWIRWGWMWKWVVPF